MLPNAFIVGAQKSGTTTLCYALEHHPQVVVSTPKEPAFFSRAANLSEPERYESCFRVKNGVAPRAIVDGTNAYMADPLAPSRIRAMLGGDLRLIFCLREPTARAFSGYWHHAKRGRELRSCTEALTFSSETLDGALQEEREQVDRAAKDGLIDFAKNEQRFDDPLWNFRYLRNSLYARDLERFIATFGADRTKIILFEELVAEPAATLKSVAIFLGLDATLFPPTPDLHRNVTALMRAPRLTEALSKIPGRTLLRRFPGYAQVRNALFFRPPPPTDAELAKRLCRLIAPEVTRLQAMVGRDVAAIWSAHGLRDANSEAFTQKATD
jgi:Sulfotransferase family